VSIPKAAAWKKDRIAKLVGILQDSKVIGVVDVAGVPARAMLGMRAALRDNMTMTMAKKTLMRRAWEEAGLADEELEAMLSGANQPLLVTSDTLSSFQLFAELAKTRTGRAPKGGDIAPNDIIVEKGDTQFPPGPIVGELQQVGIPAKIEKGKVTILKTTTVVEAGEEISADLGLMLDKLDIHPIEIRLILCGTVEDGVVLDAEALDIDMDGAQGKFTSGAAAAFNVACNIAWFTPQVTTALISKAAGEALAVAIEAGVVNNKTVAMMISKANSEAFGLASKLDSSALDEELSALLGSVQAAVAVSEEAPADSEEEQQEEEEEEEKDAEFGGLGDLFG
jgi:large subunit ribosomal protein L10